VRFVCAIVIAAVVLSPAGRRGAAHSAGSADGGGGEAQRLLALVNARRAQGADCARRGRRPPAGPLTLSAALGATASDHVRDMAEHGYLAHRDLGGRRPAERARLHGYRGDVGENIAWRAPDAEAALGAWLASPDHCANLMDPSFHETGIGVAPSAGYGRIWVETFGRSQ